jgi:hypothetical protein
MEFPASLQIPFDFRAAISDGAIQRILCASDADFDFLHREEHKLRTVPE